MKTSGVVLASLVRRPSLRYAGVAALPPALLLVVSSLSLIACGGDNKNPSPGPSGTSAPTSGDGGSSSTGDGPKTTSNGTGTSGDGGVKGDAGYFPGGSRLPQ